MSQASPLWPARLHHLQLESAEPERLIAFYTDGFGMAAREVGGDLWLLTGGERRLLVARGAPRKLAFSAFTVADDGQLAALRDRLASAGVECLPNPSALFGDAAFAVTDPDGGSLVFGRAGDAETAADALPGRLQHVVVATTRLDPMVEFYGDTLGFVVSDWVREESGELTTCFFRSDPEHHSFAAFRAPQAGLDHHAYETTCWNDIRDWADHFSELHVPLVWGPGRHGPGNNLFFMVHDPDGSWVEISAELEHMPLEMAAREWPHEERTLNYWGQGFLRS
jgi:catechol 2,3-dioxygenase-like lactoylglutathione lyase family enzyme